MLLRNHLLLPATLFVAFLVSPIPAPASSAPVTGPLHGEWLGTNLLTEYPSTSSKPLKDKNVFTLLISDPSSSFSSKIIADVQGVGTFQGVRYGNRFFLVQNMGDPQSFLSGKVTVNAKTGLGTSMSGRGSSMDEYGIVDFTMTGKRPKK
ncbi:MAG: hypothetical protein JNJ88_02450 [Planctomycetes bacterium]|nr:hypothetical protein [Planctomycetota bacterium]